MTLFKTKEKSTRYNVAPLYATVEQLKKWAADPDCIEKDECAKHLAKLRAEQERRLAERDEARARNRAEVQDNPFNPRTEISADAQHIARQIIKHLWIIFVLLPVVLGVLWALMK